MKKIIFFVMLLSLVSRGSYSQTTRTLQSFPKITPSLSDSVFGSHLGANRNFNITDLFNLNGPRTETLSGKSMSGSTNTFTSIPESAITNLLTDLLTLTNGLASANTAISGKQATLTSGGNIKTINGSSLLGSGNIVIAGGGGSSRGIGFSTLAYSSTINIDFNSTTNYAITATGNISFTNSNITSGEDFEVKIIKNTSSNIILSFPSSSWTAPSINNNAPGMAKVIQTSPPGFTLIGASGSIYSVYIHHEDLLPVITLNNTANFYDPPTLATNIVVWDGRATFVDAGVTTAETSVYHIMIPNGTMKANSRATVKFWMKRGTGGSNVQFKVRSGASTTPTSNSIVYDFGGTGSLIPGLSPVDQAIFQNNNSTSSQIAPVNYNAVPSNYPITESNFSIPTGSDFYIDITVQKTSSGDVGAAGMIELILSNI